MEEIPLSGGRVTAGVVRAGDTVRRPCCPNSPFVHRVLSFLEEKDAPAPRFLGLDDRGREIISFLPGQVPDNLGYFSEEQLSAAGKLIRTLHDALSDFPDCSPGETVCHRDLSPCNFLFTGGLPAFVIDWDAAMVGNPLDDLAYALWMWLDMGNRGNPPRDTARRAKFLLTQSDEPLYSIAEQTGFHDASYLVKVFKRYAGMTPNDYRQHYDSFGRRKD